MKNNKGITLIALVVTIIVLLISAGVSIAMLTGQNGILTRASESSYKSKLQNVAESMSYNVTEALTAYYNSAYVSNDSSASASIAAAIKKGITDSITTGETTAVADTAVTVTDNTTVSTDATPAITGTVTLSYSNHSKVGTVTNSGISWADVN